MFEHLRRPIVVVGEARSGVAAKELLIAGGVRPQEILVFDDKEGPGRIHDARILLDQICPQTLIVSPGYPLHKPWIQELKTRKNVEITSELSLAHSLLSTEKIIGVTGSLGKSTTVALMGELLKCVDPHVFIGANFGTPLAVYVRERMQEKRPKAQYLVLELSSYQLENAQGLECDWGFITFFAPNHLERYSDLESYYQTKWKLFDQTRQQVFLNLESLDLKEFAEKHPSPKARWVETHSELLKNLFSKTQLIGTHNHQNLAMAFVLIDLVGIPKQSGIEALARFQGLPHRIENIGQFQNIHFINDSKATTIESVKTAIAAVQSQMKASARLHLLLGGRDKNLPWKELIDTVEKSSLCPYFFGEAASLVASALKKEGPLFKTLNDALGGIYREAGAGDFVLLSPGGTSLDEFKSFEDRGLKFSNYVQNLWTKSHIC